MEDKKYIKIIKDEFYYEVFYLEDDEIEKKCFVFKNVLTSKRLESFEHELNTCYAESTDNFDENETYKTYTLYDLINNAGMFEKEPQTYFDMMLKANEIINNEIRQHSDVESLMSYIHDKDLNFKFIGEEEEAPNNIEHSTFEEIESTLKYYLNN
ncbi:TPA: hypothetical protein K8Z82_001856 [Staphylococcus pseudintermedius]|uniref:hypothetical protein n=1 Tax=Staphylococcus pseudintermedius TaxID=283734 RepID=UPI000E285549|nr:hypothetical protein [Staphylococcus pseudintermedius]REA72565.1 hypothetical protein DV960_00610 [Staphylococcus pseudintermedius]HCT0479115.1 hypothetical protein [Staphylococcus pseudintermedius]